jgi:hypothetical protein
MPITVACECGKQLRVKEELAGKKIRCPGCQAIVAVPAADAEMEESPRRPARADAIEEDEVPAPKASRKAAPVEDEEPPRKPAKKPAQADDHDDDYVEEEDRYAARKKKAARARLFAVLGVGVIVLGLACAGGGVLLYYFVINPPPSRILVGKWQVDTEATLKLYPENEQKLLHKSLERESFGTLEFRSDGTLETGKEGAMRKDKWEKVSSQGDTVTIDIISEYSLSKGKTDELSSRWTITVKSRDQILLAPAEKKGTDSFKGLVLKRM